MGLATRREHIQLMCANLSDSSSGSATNGILRKFVVLLQEQIEELRVEIEHLKAPKGRRRKKEKR